MGLRSGSKGVIGKNIRPLCGKPLFRWSLDAAIKSSSVRNIIVSSDSCEYLDLVRGLKKVIPLLRPKNLATDQSTDEEYIVHAIDYFGDTIFNVNCVIIRACATSPFQTSQDYDILVKVLTSSTPGKSCMAVAECGVPMEKTMILDRNNNLVTTGKQSRVIMPRQKCSKLFKRSNLIGIRRDDFIASRSLALLPAYPVFIPKERSIDIDTEHDFLLAQMLLTHYIDNSININSFSSWSYKDI